MGKGLVVESRFEMTKVWDSYFLSTRSTAVRHRTFLSIRSGTANCNEVTLPTSPLALIKHCRRGEAQQALEVPSSRNLQ